MTLRDYSLPAIGAQDKKVILRRSWDELSEDLKMREAARFEAVNLCHCDVRGLLACNYGHPESVAG